MLTYMKACVQDYRAKLRAEARAEGLKDHRVGVCRLAQRKLEDSTAKDLAHRIRNIGDSARLWGIGDLIIDCSEPSEIRTRLREFG